MPLMRAPDGSETVEVPMSEYRHFLSLGATVVGQPPSSDEYFAGRGPSAPYSGTPDAGGGMEVPFYADPMEIPAAMMAGPAMRMGQAAAGAMGRGAAAAGGAVGGAVSRVAGSGLGKAALSESIELLPYLPRRMVRAGQAIHGALRGGAERAAAKTAEQAAPAIPKGKTLVREYLRSVPKPKPKLVKPASAGEARIATLKAAESKKPAIPEAAKKRIELGKKADKPRHDVQYYSESKKSYTNIEDMNQKHIETAFRKLAEKNPKAGSVGRRVLDALLDESKHRLETTGIHVGQ